MIELLAAACGGVLIGWICQARLLHMVPPRGRYGGRFDPGRIQRGNGHGEPTTPKQALGTRRQYIYNPVTMAECGGPCFEAQDPRSCDCGALWRDVPARWPTIYVEDFPPGYWDDGIPPNLPSRLGSNPPPPGRKPEPDPRLGAPWSDPRLGVPWDEGRIQRGHGHGKPSTPKPDIIPKPKPPAPPPADP